MYDFKNIKWHYFDQVPNYQVHSYKNQAYSLQYCQFLYHVTDVFLVLWER